MNKLKRNKSLRKNSTQATKRIKKFQRHKKSITNNDNNNYLNKSEEVNFDKKNILYKLSLLLTPRKMDTFYRRSIINFKEQLDDPSFIEHLSQSEELQLLLSNLNEKTLSLLNKKESTPKRDSTPLNEIGLPMTILEQEVQEMVDRGKQDLPPKHPYFSNEWDSVISFVKKTYGKYLSSCNSEKIDYLYIHHLGSIHPSNEKKSRLKLQLKKLLNNPVSNKQEIIQLENKLNVLNSKEYKLQYGSDVKQAIINYFSKKPINYSEFIKTKSDYINNLKDTLKQLLSSKQNLSQKEIALLKSTNIYTYIKSDR